jgi:transaldolase
MRSTLDHLRSYSIVVADTADIDAIARFSPVDATTNPSLVLKQAAAPETKARIAHTRARLALGELETVADAAMDLAVQLGAEISKLIPGYVSTEVDARLSFDTDASITQAHAILERYQSLGVSPDRILIKLAATWEGIEACRQLERQGISCNLTLVFSEEQAIAAAHANATLISPFVGRIYDWYVARDETPENATVDPGVLSVQRIHWLYRSHGIKTIVMGASFRTAEQVLALAGCDRLTISPAILEELGQRTEPVQPIENPPALPGGLPTMDRNQFMLALASNAMATEKLADGVHRFVQDQIALEALIRS